MAIVQNPAIAQNVAQPPQPDQMQQMLQAILTSHQQQGTSPQTAEQPSALEQIASLNNNTDGQHPIQQMSALSNMMGYDEGTLFGYSMKPPQQQGSASGSDGLTQDQNLGTGLGPDKSQTGMGPDSSGEQSNIWSNLWSSFSKDSNSGGEE